MGRSSSTTPYKVRLYPTEAQAELFENTFGHPKFKRKKDDKDSFAACNHEFESGPTIYTTKDGIRMTKAGMAKAKFSRHPQGWWKLKRITVEKTRTGKYFCSILYEVQAKEPDPVLPTLETAVGLKYFVSHFYVTDDGSRADPPHWLKESREKLTALQKEDEPDAGRFQPIIKKRFRNTSCSSMNISPISGAISSTRNPGG